MYFYFICMNKHVGITLSVLLFGLQFFPVSDLRKLALSTTLHPKCVSLVKKLQCVPIVPKKATMCLFLCSIKIRSQVKHAKQKMLCPKIDILTPPPVYIFYLDIYPFTTGATTVGVTVIASLKLCTMQYTNIIDTLNINKYNNSE